MTALLNNKLFVTFLAPFLLGGITILGFPPFNLTFLNFFTFSVLLFLILVIKKRTQSKYRKKKSSRYFFYLGSAFGFGFFLLGNYWISISLTNDETFHGLIQKDFGMNKIQYHIWMTFPHHSNAYGMSTLLCYDD